MQRERSVNKGPEAGEQQKLSSVGQERKVQEG